MSTLKVNTVLSADTPTVNVTDGLNVTGVSTFSGITNTIGSGNVIALMDSTNNAQNHRVRINSQGSSSSTSLSISNSNANNQTSLVHGNDGVYTIRSGQTAGAEPTSGSERLRIDTNGNVTKPTSFHILVNRSGNQTGYNASNLSDPVIWNNVVSSQSSTGASSHFNTSTGLLTIPVTGLYWIHASVNADFSNEGGWIIVDGSRPATASTFYPNASASADGTIVYYLTANQTLGIKWYDNGNTNATINANALHTFCRIVLLG
tara:strand:+ start:248 stop:1033 length:786 start_codon:yes stop_codon:yes gene_type:complete